ncbi:M43 family zinc metalloprotease [Schleiferia thermophila]
MKKIVSCFLFLPVLISAQVNFPHRCGTNHMTEQLVLNNPSLKELIEEYDQILAKGAQEYEMIHKRTQNNLIIIPVVFHVIYDDAVSNISREQIMDAIRALNDDFRRRNNDTVNTRPIFKPLGADVEIEFRLASIDPFGNCTDGINRIFSNLTNNANDNVKNLSMWNNRRYLNIWVVKNIQLPNQPAQGTVLGYAYRPFFNQPGINDGIVIRHDRVGTIGTSNTRGRTLTHEVGHFLGLKHPFDGGCFGGDDIADTPPVANESFGCNLQKNTCSNDVPDLPDMIENYMDYANDNCMNIFTIGQRNYMRNVLSTFAHRAELVSQANLQRVGLINNTQCPPKAFGFAPRRVACLGDTLQFIDISAGGPALSRTWSFAGGTPSTSSDENPSVIFNQPGLHKVELTLTNAAGTSTFKNYEYITVRPKPANFGNFLKEDFSVTWLPSFNWFVEDVNNTGNSWTTATNAGYNDLRSARILNADTMAGTVHNLISPTVDVRFSTNLTMRFRYAYARRDPSNNDALRFYISLNCGRTWILRRAVLGNQIITAPDMPTGSFVPTNNSEWKEVTVPLGIYSNFPEDIMFKWEFTSGGGNNFYLDDINLDVVVGQDEWNSPSEISVYPNPVFRGGIVIFEAPLELGQKVKLLSITGQVVAEFENLNNQTTQELQIPASLSPGVYFLVTGSGISKKLIVR